jgi:anti-anti-sigma factor
MLGELDVQHGTTRVTLHGELDLVTIESLRRILADAVLGHPKHVVVDLSDVPFMDVLSLSTILAAADAQRERGGTLVVAGAAPSVRRVCALLNADDVLAPDLPFPRASNS